MRKILPPYMPKSSSFPRVNQQKRKVADDRNYLKANHEQPFFQFRVKRSDDMKGLASVNEKQVEKIFLSIYKEILERVVGQEISRGKKTLTSLNLVISTISYINQLTKESLDALLDELDWFQLVNEGQEVGEAKLKALLTNPRKVANYLNMIVYKVDFTFSLISLYGAKLTSYSLEEAAYDGEGYIYNDLNLAKSEIYLPMFLTIIKIIDKNINYKNLEFSDQDRLQFDEYCINFFLETFYHIKQEPDLTLAIDTSTRFLVEEKYRSLRDSCRDLVLACLQNNQSNLIDKIKSILQIASAKEALPFVFHSAFKALLLSGRQEVLDTFFLEFSKAGVSHNLLGFDLVEAIYSTSDELEGEEIENNLENLAEYLFPSKLLNLAELSPKNNLASLNWIWDKLIFSLEEGIRSNILVRAISEGFLLEQNDITVLSWYEQKFATLDNFYVQNNLNYKAILIERLHQSWMRARDYGAGQYTRMLKYKKISAVFNIVERENAIDLLEWTKNVANINEGFEQKELIFDLAVKTEQEAHWFSALDDLLRMPDIEKIKTSYSYSRFVAVSVIKNDLRMLEKFWNKIDELDNQALKMAIQKRLLVDSTWAFHQALRHGQLDFITFFLAKVNDLPAEERLGHLGYRCDLLYGLDSFSAARSKQNPIINAVISGDTQVLEAVYREMRMLDRGLSRIDSESEIFKLINAPIATTFPDVEKRRGILTELKRDYSGSVLNDLGYIPALYNYRNFIEQFNEMSLIQEQSKENFILSAHKAAVNFHNKLMLHVTSLVQMSKSEAFQKIADNETQDLFDEVNELEIKEIHLYIKMVIAPLLSYEGFDVKQTLNALWEWDRIKNSKDKKLKAKQFIREELINIPEQRHGTILAWLQSQSAPTSVLEEPQAGPSGWLPSRQDSFPHDLLPDSDEEIIPAKKICFSGSKRKRQTNNACEMWVKKLNKRYKIERHLQKLSHVSERVMQGMMAKSVLGAFLRNDYKEVAINLGFIVGGQGLAKLAEVTSLTGSKLVLNNKWLLGQSLRVASPFLKRGISAFVLYDLTSQLAAFRNGSRGAQINIAGDATYLGIDAIETGVEIAEAFGLFEGVSSITGPIGSSIAALVFVGTDIYQSVEKVHEIDELIPLTANEKLIEGLRAFIGMRPEGYIEELIHEKQLNNQRVREILNYLKQHPTIQRYVFPIGLDNTVDLSKKRFVRRDNESIAEAMRS